MEATKEQKLAIRRNSQYNEDIKAEWVQWATNDNSKTSLNDLSFEQANRILAEQGEKQYKGENWGLFNSNNSKHKYILSLMYQMNWTVEIKGRYVPDTNRLSEFLKSKKSPVQKPLKEMNILELAKIIQALEEITKKTWK